MKTTSLFIHRGNKEKKEFALRYKMRELWKQEGKPIPIYKEVLIGGSYLDFPALSYQDGTSKCILPRNEKDVEEFNTLSAEYDRDFYL
jgi:hypothetical protein